jgi:hypothetical protein
MNKLDLLYIIPLSIVILFFIIVIGVTLISIMTGNIEMGQKMMESLFKNTKKYKI